MRDLTEKDDADTIKSQPPAQHWWPLITGVIVGFLVAVIFLVTPISIERNEYRKIAKEQAETITRYEAIASGYEKLTGELFEMIAEVERSADLD